MVKKMKKIIINIMIVVDHFIFLLVFPFCLIGLLFAIPWILKQRRIWQYSAKGSRKAVILREFKIEKVMKRGYELLLPYKNPNINWIGFLDPANSREAGVKSWKKPDFLELP
jgi:hypothetical protein